jgi:hypothetical protein
MIEWTVITVLFVSPNRMGQEKEARLLKFPTEQHLGTPRRYFLQRLNHCRGSVAMPMLFRLLKTAPHSDKVMMAVAFIGSVMVILISAAARLVA